MLKKLIKNEFKATSRIYAVIYLVFAVLLTVERLSFLTSGNVEDIGGIAGQLSQILLGILTTLTVLGVIALWATPAIYGIYRFYKNMLSDEGYLSFTLPVTVSQHLWSKVIVACVWQVVTILFSCLVGGLFLSTLDWQVIVEAVKILGEGLGIISESAGGWFYLTAFLLVVAVLIRMVVTYLTYFSAMSIGQCANKHKFLLSVGVFVGFQVALSTLLQLFNALLFVVSRGTLMIHAYSFLDVILSGSDAGVHVCQLLSLGLAVLCVLDVLLGVLHFFLSRHFLTKKLNLA